MSLLKGFGLTIGNLHLLDKRFFLFLLSIVVLLIVLKHIIPKSYGEGEVKMVLIPNKTNIKDIDQKRDKLNQYTFYLEKLNLTRSKTKLIHPAFGDLGFKKNFFIDFMTSFELDQDQEITFSVFSDDGFNLFIDGKNILSYKTGRPIAQDEITLSLKKGTHSYKLEYYQGSGYMGVKAFYKINKSRYYIGEKSEFASFYK